MTLSLPPSDMRQLLPLADAVTAVSCGSDSAFYRWAAKWRVRHFRQGLYRRSNLADAMEREAGKKRK